MTVLLDMPRRQGGAAPALPVEAAFPMIIAEWDRNAREVVRVALDRFGGRHTINIRVWYRENGELRPGKAGITLGVGHLRPLAQAIGTALTRARSLGLVDDRSAR